MLRLAISIARLAASRNRRLTVATRDFIDRIRDIVAIEFEGQSDPDRDEKVLRLKLHRIGVGIYSADTGDGELTIRTYSETDPTITVTSAPATGKERGE